MTGPSSEMVLVLFLDSDGLGHWPLNDSIDRHHSAFINQSQSKFQSCLGTHFDILLYCMSVRLRIEMTAAARQ